MFSFTSCSLSTLQEFKNSRGSDARIVTCINLHVRLGQAIQDKDTAFQERDQALKDKDTAFQERDQALKDKDTAFQERDQALKDKENAFQERDQALKDKDTACRELDQALKDKDNMNRGFTEQIRELEKKLASKVHMVYRYIHKCYTHIGKAISVDCDDHVVSLSIIA